MKTKKPVRGLDNIIGVNYCRYSSHSQRDASIEQQMAASQAYARANGITIIETYADRATTGRNDDRREFQRMMKDAEHGRFQCVIAWKSDRLGRNMLQAMQNEARLNSLGIFCVYVEENFDDTAAGRFAKRNMMNVNQFYSESMAENITRGLQYNAENCMVTNGQLPFGYKADSSLHYALDVPKDEIVREIFIRVSNGEPMVDIYTSLNERGILTSRGKPWTKSGFNSLLHNERYKGIYIYGDTRIENGIPRIISDELFDKVQKVLTMKKNPRGRHRSEATYLLTGKLYCGYCKKPMTGMSGRSKSGENHYYYACSNKRLNGAAACKKKPVRKEQIELAIAQFIKEQLNNPETQNGIIEFLLACQDRYHRMPELEMAQSRQEEVKKSIKNLLNAMEAGVVTPTTKDRLMELESENAKLEEKIVSLKILSTKNYTREQIAEWFSVLQKGEIDDKQYQQQIFELFLRKAYIYDDKVRLFLDLSAFSGDEESYADMDLDTFDDCIEGEENVRIGFDLSHHGVASSISLAALSSCFAFEIAASLIPLLRLFPTKSTDFAEPLLQLRSLFFGWVRRLRNRVKAPRKLHIHQFLSALAQTRLKLFEPTEAIVYAEGRRKASFNASAMDAIISPRARAGQSFMPAKCERQEITLPLGLRFPSHTASRTSYCSRRHFYVLSNATLIHSVIPLFSANASICEAPLCRKLHIACGAFLFSIHESYTNFPRFYFHP